CVHEPAVELCIDSPHFRQTYPMRQSTGSHHRYSLLRRPSLNCLTNESPDLNAAFETRHRWRKSINHDRYNRDVPVRSYVRKRHYFSMIEWQISRRREI